MTSKTLAALLAVVSAACISAGSTQDTSGNPVYEATGSCEVMTIDRAKMLMHMFDCELSPTDEPSLHLQVCSRTAALWRRPATNHCVGAVVEVLCNSGKFLYTQA